MLILLSFIRKYKTGSERSLAVFIKPHFLQENYLLEQDKMYLISNILITYLCQHIFLGTEFPDNQSCLN